MAAHCVATPLLVCVFLHLITSAASVHAHLRRYARISSSHGLRASAFRAAGASTLRHGSTLGLLSRQEPGAVPLYVPKIGLANVTEPTAFPPPPPALDPWKDMQPLDTAVGYRIIAGFVAQPTVTPPPTQASLDMAFACPVLLNWPSEVAVSAPDATCGSKDSGNWTSIGDKSLLLNWARSCIHASTYGSQPLTTYTMPNGDTFGTSTEYRSVFGNYIELRDCGGAPIYTVHEKVYKQLGNPDEQSCKKFNSCDGVIYVQYFVKDSQGETVALSGYTHLFEPTVDITDPAGNKIATLTRDGWDPPIQNETCVDAKPRQWLLRFAPTPPGVWAIATNQWPIAAMMTMLAQRDEVRQPDGSLLWTNCEVLRTSFVLASICLIVLVCILVPIVVCIVCAVPCNKFLVEYERQVFPKVIECKPAMYDNIA